MNRTYSEQRQAILFKASRELRGIAALILDEVTEPAELTGRTAPWAKSTAAKTATMANDLEKLGYEQTPATPRMQSDLHKSHRAYEVAIDAFEARIRSAGGTVP